MCRGIKQTQNMTSHLHDIMDSLDNFPDNQLEIYITFASKINQHILSADRFIFIQNSSRKK